MCVCVYVCVCFVFGAVFCGVFDLDMVVFRHDYPTPPCQNHFQEVKRFIKSAVTQLKINIFQSLKYPKNRTKSTVRLVCKTLKNINYQRSYGTFSKSFQILIVVLPWRDSPPESL